MKQSCIKCKKGKAYKKFCGFQCYWEYRKENKLWPPSRKGMKHSDKYKRYMSSLMKSKNLKGEKNFNWKGNSVTYSGLHSWLLRNFVKKTKCDHCNKNKNRLEWANKSGKYLRNIKDYFVLCNSCHFKFDDIGKKMWITRRSNGYIK